MIYRAKPGVNLLHLFIGHHKAIREKLSIHLGDERRDLRLVCRALNHASTRQVGQLFRKLYVQAPALDKDTNVARVVAPLCHHLTISIDRCTAGSKDLMNTPQSLCPRSSNRRRAQASLTRHLWIRLLSSFHQLRTLTIRITGTLGYAIEPEVEEALVTLRIAVEQNRLPELKTLELSPISIICTFRFRWSGFGAFGSMPALSRIWRQLETLDLRILSPLASNNIEDQDAITFKKVFYNYLKSFSKTLRVLRVIWLRSQGPSPLTLHLEPGLEGRPAIQWSILEELWIGNISLPFRTVKVSRSLVPSLSTMKMLRSTHRESRLADASDSSAWMDVELDRAELARSRASSVYSQRSEHSVDPIEDVSQSSRSILVYRDF